MLLRNFVPLVVMGGITLHSGSAIKARALNFIGLGDKLVARNRLVAILDAAVLHAVEDENIDLRSQQAFRRFVKKNVRVRGSQGRDSSLDPWGIPFRGEFDDNVLKVASAGPDGKFGTKDDVVDSRKIMNDY